MIGVLNDAAIALMTSIGHQVGLFDVMATLPPSSSAEIAAAADAQERYVREWLGAMTTGRLVEHDPGTGTYWLPAEHAACLTRSAGPDNIAHMMEFVPLLAGVEQEVIAVLPPGRRGAVQRVPAISPGDGGGQRDGARRGPGRRHPSRSCPG